MELRPTEKAISQGLWPPPPWPPQSPSGPAASRNAARDPRKLNLIKNLWKVLDSPE
jgi:hypothetical protein